MSTGVVVTSRGRYPFQSGDWPVYDRDLGNMSSFAMLCVCVLPKGMLSYGKKIQLDTVVYAIQGYRLLGPERQLASMMLRSLTSFFLRRSSYSERFRRRDIRQRSMLTCMQEACPGSNGIINKVRHTLNQRIGCHETNP